MSEIGHDRIPSPLEGCESVPVLINESNNPVAKLGPSLKSADELKCACVRAHNEYVAKVSSLEANAF